MESNEQNDLKFEEAMEKLEQIVEQLEKGGLDLEKSLEKFTTGIELIKYCSKELDKAEEKIEMVLKEDEEFGEIVDFNFNNQEGNS